MHNGIRSEWYVIESIVVDVTVILTSSISPSYADCPLPLLAPSAPLSHVAAGGKISWQNSYLPSPLRPPARPRLRRSLLCSKYMVSLRSDLFFLPSFRLSSAVYLDVFRRRDAKGPLRRPLSEISSIAAAAATEITFVLPSFRPALQPISEGSPIDGETDRPCPILLPFLSSSVTCLFGLLCSIHSTGQDSV